MSGFHCIWSNGRLVRPQGQGELPVDWGDFSVGENMVKPSFLPESWKWEITYMYIYERKVILEGPNFPFSWLWEEEYIICFQVSQKMKDGKFPFGKILLNTHLMHEEWGLEGYEREGYDCQHTAPYLQTLFSVCNFLQVVPNYTSYLSSTSVIYIQIIESVRGFDVVFSIFWGTLFQKAKCIKMRWYMVLETSQRFSMGRHSNCIPLLPRTQHIPSAASLMHDPQWFATEHAAPDVLAVWSLQTSLLWDQRCWTPSFVADSRCIIEGQTCL